MTEGADLRCVVDALMSAFFACRMYETSTPTPLDEEAFAKDFLSRLKDLGGRVVFD